MSNRMMLKSALGDVWCVSSLRRETVSDKLVKLGGWKLRWSSRWRRLVSLVSPPAGCWSIFSLFWRLILWLWAYLSKHWKKLNCFGRVHISPSRTLHRVLVGKLGSFSPFNPTCHSRPWSNYRGICSLPWYIKPYPEAQHTPVYIRTDISRTLWMIVTGNWYKTNHTRMSSILI